MNRSSQMPNNLIRCYSASQTFASGRINKHTYIWLHTSHIFKLPSVVVLCEGSGWVMLRMCTLRTQRSPGSLALRDC